MKVKHRVKIKLPEPRPQNEEERILAEICPLSRKLRNQDTKNSRNDLKEMNKMIKFSFK